MRLCFALVSIVLFAGCHTKKTIAQMKDSDFSLPPIPHEQNKNATATYAETIAFFEAAAKHPFIELRTYGSTDAGKPLHLAVISNDGNFDPDAARKNGKRIFLVNNGIHPGEPCGVDASMQLVRDLIMDSEASAMLDNVVLCMIPMYNIGGALNRNSHTRTNQDGPESYGFRGNARNLDLNRDFIKCDSKNAKAFTIIFREWEPDVFVDTHTSNGADYQYTMTMIATQHNKLHPSLGNFLDQELMPKLYAEMKNRNWEMTPYVYARESPHEGILAFLDSPRYSSGYAALFNTLSFMPEAHMLKPFEDRVASTKAFLEAMLEALNGPMGLTLDRIRRQVNESTKTQMVFDIDWELDRSKQDVLMFKGYTAKRKPSAITGMDRLYYDRNEPYEMEIPYWKTYKSKLSVDRPDSYFIPQAWTEVIERLELNGVEITTLTEPKTVEVEVYYIRDFKDRDAYEGHYLHSNVIVEKRTEAMTMVAGDYEVVTNQDCNRYIIETLEPQAPDSYFAWNFFDSILQQKEYFSSYVFEDLAAKILAENPDLKKQLEQRKSEDEEFAKSAYRQLEFVYKNSPHYEPTHRRYPVYRYFGSN
ncbi:MAG: M14 family metallopeptidase [Bacteroidota bacterium]